jgi:hypothetical protein
LTLTSPDTKAAYAFFADSGVATLLVPGTKMISSSVGMNMLLTSAVSGAAAAAADPAVAMATDFKTLVTILPTVMVSLVALWLSVALTQWLASADSDTK